MVKNETGDITDIIERAVLQGLKNVSSTLPLAIANGLNVKEYFNVAEAAEFTRLAKQTIYQKVSMRAIPFIKNGGRVIFRRSELQEWMNEGSKKWLRK